MLHTYIIPEANLPKLQEDLAKLNKRAGKLKVTPITLEATHAYQELEYIDPTRPKLEPRWFTDHELSYTAVGSDIKVVGAERTFISGLAAQLTGRIRQWVYITVAGETPKFAGWSLVGCLEPLTLEDGSAKNIVRTVPGHTIPAEYRNRIGECDHCNAIRRRKETFVVQHEDGRCKMVGRQCIKDFLGHKDPHSLARMAEWLMELAGLCEGAEKEDWMGGGGREPNSWSLDYFLKITSAVIRKEGWLSRTKAQEFDKTPTSSYIMFYLSPPPSNREAAENHQKYKAEIDTILTDPIHEQDAGKALDWCKELEPKDGEDYLYNINLVARSGYVKDKTVGLAASILAAYRRATGQVEEPKGPRPVSQHIGAVKDKLELDVQCKKVISVEGMYGSTGIHKMEDDVGNSLTWFASGGTTWLHEGGYYRIKGTVKAHDEYKGQKQTILTRVKILKEYDDDVKAQDETSVVSPVCLLRRTQQ